MGNNEIVFVCCCYLWLMCVMDIIRATVLLLLPKITLIHFPSQEKSKYWAFSNRLGMPT